MMTKAVEDLASDTVSEAAPVQIPAVRMLLYAVASVGTGAFYAFNNFVLPPILQGFGASNLIIGLLSSTRSIEGALIQPTIGALSDRTWTPVGRRRPFLVIEIPLSAIFFLAAAGANSLLPLAVAIFLFSIFFDVAADPYAALLPDITPLHKRGVLSGLSTAVQLVQHLDFHLYADALEVFWTACAISLSLMYRPFGDIISSSSLSPPLVSTPSGPGCQGRWC